MASSRYGHAIIRPRQDAIEVVRENLRRSPDLVERVLRKNGASFSRATLKDLKREPGRVRYPIRWKTERQRRAFFATNGFGAGIPTKRTGKFTGAWRIDIDYRGGMTAEVWNRMPYGRFVGGDDQQPFHKDTGWYYAPRLVETHWLKFLDDIEDSFFEVIDPTAGI